MAEIYDISTDIAAILTEELEAGKARIIENSERAGQKASGKTYRSMRVEVIPDAEGTHGIMTARPFFAALETGSRPWRTQYLKPPRFFAEIIEEWINDKGLDLNPYAVATTIMRKGSKLKRQGGRADIFTPEIQTIGEKVQERTAGLFQSLIVESILRNTNQQDTI